ncbi:MAG TPA: hypothetical protein VMX15_07060 [Candidatus Heimdallarchaeota archaeon]|nr:hypothetical protein [Candidatus Heimdallarchaeota archaeon]
MLAVIIDTADMKELATDIHHVIREETLFAGIRKPIKGRDELLPRMEEVRRACEGKAVGPLTHIFRFDTPVEGYDSEIGFPVSAEVNAGDVRTHTLRELHFFSLLHTGPVEMLRETTGKISAHMNRVGLSSELELVEIYHQFDPSDESQNLIEARIAFLTWPEVYWEQLVRVLGTDLAEEIWAGGEGITPFTLVDDRVKWVEYKVKASRLEIIGDYTPKGPLVAEMVFAYKCGNSNRLRETRFQGQMEESLQEAIGL